MTQPGRLRRALQRYRRLPGHQVRKGCPVRHRTPASALVNMLGHPGSVGGRSGLGTQGPQRTFPPNGRCRRPRSERKPAQASQGRAIAGVLTGPRNWAAVCVGDILRHPRSRRNPGVQGLWRRGCPSNNMENQYVILGRSPRPIIRPIITGETWGDVGGPLRQMGSAGKLGALDLRRRPCLLADVHIQGRRAWCSTGTFRYRPA